MLWSSDIFIVWQERMHNSPSPSPSLEEAQMSSNHSSSVSSSPSHSERTAETTRTYIPVRSTQESLNEKHFIYTCRRDLWVIFSTCYIILVDPLDNGLSSSHNLLGHSPGVVHGARETDVASVEHCKENKRGHSDRGKTHSYVCVAWVSIEWER